MSDAAYRSSREAAKARADALEAELGELKKKSTALPAYPALATDPEKEQLRKRLGALAKSRKLLPLIGLIGAVTLLRLGGSDGSAVLALLAVILAVSLFAFSRIPGRQERELESKLRAIVRAEDESDRKFRVESGPIQKRIDDEKAERAQLEQELEEARAMAEEDSAERNA